MGVAASTRVVRSSPNVETACKLVVGNGEYRVQLMEFVVAGLEAGQQILAIGAPDFLREIAWHLTESGHKPEGMLHNERLLFLTAPECFFTLDCHADLFRRLPLHRNGSMLRCASDWSWLKAHNVDLQKALCYQRRVHELARSLEALSICTAESAKLDRNSLLAMMANHRRSVKPQTGPC